MRKKEAKKALGSWGEVIGSTSTNVQCLGKEQVLFLWPNQELTWLVSGAGKEIIMGRI